MWFVITRGHRSRFFAFLCFLFLFPFVLFLFSVGAFLFHLHMVLLPMMWMNTPGITWISSLFSLLGTTAQRDTMISSPSDAKNCLAVGATYTSLSALRRLFCVGDESSSHLITSTLETLCDNLYSQSASELYGPFSLVSEWVVAYLFFCRLLISFHSCLVLFLFSPLSG